MPNPSSPVFTEIPAVSASKFSLCDRLRLSLPALVTWAYDRCATKLQWLDTESCSSTPTAAPGISDCPNPETQPSSVTDRQLLTATIDAIDRWAAHPLQSHAFWRQAYALATAVYQFDAEWTLPRLRSLSASGYNTAHGTLQAAHSLLLLMLTQIDPAIVTNHRYQSFHLPTDMAKARNAESGFSTFTDQEPNPNS
jgi:hypothetical protein